MWKRDKTRGVSILHWHVRRGELCVNGLGQEQRVIEGRGKWNTAAVRRGTGGLPCGSHGISLDHGLEPHAQPHITRQAEHLLTGQCVDFATDMMPDAKRSSAYSDARREHAVSGNYDAVGAQERDDDRHDLPLQ
jgi:hypothetical protein